MSWFSKKCTHSDEYATLFKRLTDLELRMDKIELFEDNMRNMARKIQRGKPPESEDLNNSSAGLLRGRIQK